MSSIEWTVAGGSAALPPSRESTSGARWNRFGEMTTLRERARDGTLRLDDGRGLGYAEYGEPTGTPIVYLHGMPGSRLDPALLDEEYGRLGARVVALER